MKWTAAILAGWGALLAWSTFQAALPAAWWFDAGAVRVFDTTVSEPCARMDFDRVIEREFYAQWTVTLMKQNGTGGYFTYDTFSGANDYRPENELPEQLDLCWWSWADTLRLLPGTYKVHTLWKLQVDGGTREIRRTSNAFEVRAAG